MAVSRWAYYIFPTSYTATVAQKQILPYKTSSFGVYRQDAYMSPADILTYSEQTVF